MIELWFWLSKQDGGQRLCKLLISQFSTINSSETTGANVLKHDRVIGLNALYKRSTFCIGSGGFEVGSHDVSLVNTLNVLFQ